MTRPRILVTPDQPMDTMAREVARTLATSPHPTVPHDIRCGQCERRLAVATAHAGLPKKLGTRPGYLPEVDDCRWCGRPISERALAQAPRAGYIAAARALLPAHSHGQFDPAERA